MGEGGKNHREGKTKETQKKKRIVRLGWSCCSQFDCLVFLSTSGLLGGGHVLTRGDLGVLDDVQDLGHAAPPGVELLLELLPLRVGEDPEGGLARDHELLLLVNLGLNELEANGYCFYQNE